MFSFHIYLYGPQRGPIETSFEEAEARLTQLPKLYFEPDGSFVWARGQGSQQVFGMLYDAGGKLRYCDLRGHCDLTTWRQLCRAIGGEELDGLQVFRLPEQMLQDLQSFEANFLSN